MSANQACFPIAAMARVLGVSKAGYYAWLQRPPSARATADAALLKRIETVHAGSRQTYGAPRVHADLHGHGERHSRKRIARLMREAGLVGASHRRAGPTTTRRNKDDRPAPDLVDRDFNAAGPNQLWVADITYVPTMAGFLYLAVVLDAWSRKIVGWAMANHLRADTGLRREAYLLSSQILRGAPQQALIVSYLTLLGGRTIYPVVDLDGVVRRAQLRHQCVRCSELALRRLRPHPFGAPSFSARPNPGEAPASRHR